MSGPWFMNVFRVVNNGGQGSFDPTKLEELPVRIFIMISAYDE